MPLLISTDFCTDVAKDYFTKVLKNGEKDTDVAVFAPVFRKSEDLSDKVKKELRLKILKKKRIFVG